MMTSHLKIRRLERRRRRRRPNWRVGGGWYEELAVGEIHVFPMETSTFYEIQS